MDDDIIRKGDLCMSVRAIPCCGNDRYIGEIFIAGKRSLVGGNCTHCHKDTDAECVFVEGEYSVRPVSTLKKINPPSIETSTERETETT